MRKHILTGLLLGILSHQSIAADISTNEQVIQKLFTSWTNAFNQRDLTASCNLFSKQVTAVYRGYPEKNYADICDGFKKVFSDSNKQYHYDFRLHSIYMEKNLAAVRVTWYLQVTENGKTLPIVHDEGLDVLMREKDGMWRIVNYLGYEV